MAKFNPKEPYSTVMGEGKPKFLQDGVTFDRNGVEIKETGKKQDIPPAVPKVTGKPKAKPPVTKADQEAAAAKSKMLAD